MRVKSLVLATTTARPYAWAAHILITRLKLAQEGVKQETIINFMLPFLFIVGKEDILLPVKLSKELAEGIPNAELVILEEGGHGFFIEIADKFNKAVLEFLAKVESRFFKV